MKTKTFQLKEILPNPFRDLTKYPLTESVIEELIESIQSTNFWERDTVRINEDGRPELVSGHHTLAALKRLYPGTKEFDWKVESLTDGQMIARMARENNARRKFDIAVLREAIEAGVKAHGQGLILPSEMSVPSKTNTAIIRYAPSFLASAPDSGAHPYTVQALAKFLGFSKPNKREEPTDSFVAAFGAEELISEGHLKESQIKGLTGERLIELVAGLRRQRDAAKAEAERLEKEAVKRAEEAKRKAEEFKKQQAEAEERRKAAAEAERLAAIKRAEEKARRDAEEAIRRKQEEEHRKVEAQERAVKEAARKVEEERQRKIREEQRAETERQRIEAEKVRQAALAKAKIEEDKKRAEKMRQEAEAVKARAEAEAKRKEEAIRQAEVAARKRAEEEKERQKQAAIQREREEKERAEKRKKQQEEDARKEAQKVEEGKKRAEEAKRIAEMEARKKQAEVVAAKIEAEKKAVQAKKEKEEAEAQLRATAARAAEAARTINPENIRGNTQRIAEEEAAKTGRKTTSQTPGGVNPDFAKKFASGYKPRVQEVAIKTQNAVAKMAKEWVKSQYLQAAKKAHPDQGGTHEAMQLVNATKNWLNKIIEENENGL